MTLALRWRAPQRRIATRWRGPAGMAETLARSPEAPLAAIVGPPGPAGPQGPQGPQGAPLRLDAPLAATWILPHPLGRVPAVQVFLPGGEGVIADIAATVETVTVTLASPSQGFVLLS